MFKEMRKKEREVFNGDIEDILFKGEFGILSTIGDNGYPYSVPLSYVYYNNAVYFHCAEEGYKLENIKKNRNVCFCVVTDTELLPDKFTTKYKSVIVFGTADEVSGDIKENVLLQLINKYSPDFTEEGKEYIQRAKDKTKIIKIDIKHVTGKARL